jgi:hypothetical protein
LTPDGTSVWIGGDSQPDRAPGQPAENVARFDIASGQLLARWAAPPGNSSPGAPGPPLAAFGPPLLGNANVASDVDSKSSGTAEAFLTQVEYSGQMTRLHLWLDSSTTAQRVVVGVYSDRLVRPGALLTQGTITSVRPGSWNHVDVQSMSLTKGQLYWIAVLAPTGGGKVSLRDRAIGGLSWTTAQHSLPALPAQWPLAAFPGLSSHLSAYGS